MQRIKPFAGPLDHLADIDGLKIGHAHDDRVKTGVSVILPDDPCTMAVDVRGGGPGTRELEALDPSCVVNEFHGLVLSGGSAFGLDAASGVVSWLSEKGRGLKIGARPVPVVPSAILFDLANGGDKDWGLTPPYHDLAMQACDNATARNTAQGHIGAAYGAQAGSKRGGIGSASLMTDDGLQVAVLMAVNSFGEVYEDAPEGDILLPKAPMAGLNTTIGVIATNARLDKGMAKRLAMMGQDGMARAIRPIHTLFDGDSLYAMATGTLSKTLSPLEIAILGTMASDCVALAIRRAVSTT